MSRAHPLSSFAGLAGLAALALLAPAACTGDRRPGSGPLGGGGHGEPPEEPLPEPDPGPPPPGLTVHDHRTFPEGVTGVGVDEGGGVWAIDFHAVHHQPP